MNKKVNKIIPSTTEANRYLEMYDIALTDQMNLTTSKEIYNGGGQYGVEIPVINTFSTLKNTINAIESLGIYVTRFNETHGSMLLSDSEITNMLSLCQEKGYGMVIGLGPRPEYDIKGSFYRSQFGLEMGRRNNNLDAIRCSVEEALRLAKLGCRGITVYDPGVLRLLNKMRNDGFLPEDIMFKTSTHAMATNQFIVQMYAENGANSVTTAHDLGLAMIRDIRKHNPGVALDVPIDVYKTKGGFIRFHELVEIIQVSSPVMLKMGASSQDHPYDSVSNEKAFERVKRVAIGLEILNLKNNTFTKISKTNPHCCLPKVE